MYWVKNYAHQERFSEHCMKSILRFLGGKVTGQRHNTN